ncbi:CDP-diacylglycerol--inositol 3-phosphatidyltransferase [Nematocida major]|uniref:CDP-diacylglycerol--inositol 3-phosphatidyltransferase n=1 Tax=Nematocida major TaxID=1912982 RepID=UPI0020080F83|nr:CDP-diacylglycerol--inositol 3-phosphatidyltransferase [Nematocida major]KAH9387098.1 CDP-diacylglycerol--inositol 3-phosphatidyltransferase [Nematocida major]
MKDKVDKEPAPRNTILYAPNVIGYVRAILLLLSTLFESRGFVLLYSLSYLLDALDGHMARRLKQESELGYILDMSIDRASTGVLLVRISAAYPHISTMLGPCLVLDIVSHMFCVACRFLKKTSHKAHGGGGAIDKVLSVYYAKPVLFLVCLGAEVFLLNVLYFHSIFLLKVTGAVFLFKQATNILQLYKALCTLGTE